MGFWEKFGVASNEIMKLLMPLIAKFMKENGVTLLEIALKIIPIIAMTLATDSATGADSGAQKRKAAFDRIMAEAKAKGLDPSTSDINAAIEIAVATYKSSKCSSCK
jgi:hypothetical protein